MASFRETLHGWAKRAWQKAFVVGERFGVHVYPVHYYSQLPDTRDLKRRYKLWFQRKELPGVSIDPQAQIAFLEDLTAPYHEECKDLPRYEASVEQFGWGGYGEIEAYVYYCVVRRFRPRHIVEVGSGISAVYALRAGDANRQEGDDLQITSIDPFPCDGLRRLAQKGRIALVEKPVQETDLQQFTSLQENDILFIDSSHTVKMGGDVNHLVLEVLPRLSQGVLIHFHDIPWPMPCLDPFENLMFWQEPVLVQAFLAFNSDFEILLCQELIHTDHPEAYDEAFAVYDRTVHRPTSLWLRRTRS